MNNNKRLNIDNLKDYNEQMQEAYIKPLADKIDGLSVENGEGNVAVKSKDTSSDIKKVRKISFTHSDGIGYTIYTVNPDFIIYKNNGITKKTYSSNKTFTLADGSTQVIYSNNDGVVTVTLGGNDITADCDITMGINKATGAGSIAVGRVLTVNGRAAQGFGGYNEVNGEYSAAFGYNGKNYSKQSIASGNAFCVTSKYNASGNIWNSNPTYTEAESSTNLVTGSQLVVGGKDNLVAGRGVIQTANGSFDKVVDTLIDTSGNITGYKVRTTNVKNLLETDSTIQGAISGDYNIIAGNGHISLGNSNAVFGSTAKIIGNYNTVSGWDNKAFGASNTVLGEHNRVSGENITAIGRHLAVNESYNGITLKPKGTTVVGQFNTIYTSDIESPIFAVGNGDSIKRSNAMEVWSDGRAKVFAAPIDDEDVVRKCDKVENAARINDITLVTFNKKLSAKYNSSAPFLLVQDVKWRGPIGPDGEVVKERIGFEISDPGPGVSGYINNETPLVIGSKLYLREIGTEIIVPISPSLDYDSEFVIEEEYYDTVKNWEDNRIELDLYNCFE